VKFSQSISKEVRIDIALNHFEPSVQILAPAASYEPFVVPDFIVTAKRRCRDEPLYTGGRLT
jgi:hypothetical protein